MEYQKKNPHIERPSKGVMYWQTEEERLKAGWPDFKGFLVLEMDYKAGEKVKISAWQRDTSRGTPLLSLSEDNYSKKKLLEENGPREVRPSYQAPVRTGKPFQRKSVDEEDVPF